MREGTKARIFSTNQCPLSCPKLTGFVPIFFDFMILIGVRGFSVFGSPRMNNSPCMEALKDLFSVNYFISSLKHFKISFIGS